MKRLVICCDGTWNSAETAGDTPSNVLRLTRAVKSIAPDGIVQVVLYDGGVGTENLLDRITGGAFGVGLGRNVRQAYRFIVNNYVEGDEVYFFGFSRGAFTVRSTAGLIRKAGNLHKANAERIMEGWDLYRRRDAGPDNETATRFREDYSFAPVRIKFLGVWDTVGVLGIPGVLNFIGRKRFAFHDVALSRGVDFAYHAIAADEKRTFFRPTLWEQHPDPGNQVMEQAWFPGVHADVGGGYPEKGLCDAALEWMVGKARDAGLAFDDAFLSTDCTANPLDRLHESRNGPYRLIPAHHRPIGAGVPAVDAAYTPPGPTRELLSQTIVTRYAKDAGYRPPALVRHLESNAAAAEAANPEVVDAEAHTTAPQ